MRRTSNLVALVCGCLLASAALAAGIGTPAVGTPERTAVLDAARAPIEAEVGVPIKFVIEHLRVGDSWAFVSGQPVQRDGKAVDYSSTPYAEAIAEGMFDDGAVVLLQRSGETWTAVTHVIGATDVPWIGWDAEYGVPADVLPSD